jgi:hypothetical protein
MPKATISMVVTQANTVNLCIFTLFPFCLYFIITSEFMMKLHNRQYDGTIFPISATRRAYKLTREFIQKQLLALKIISFNIGLVICLIAFSPSCKIVRYDVLFPSLDTIVMRTDSICDIL